MSVSPSEFSGTTNQSHCQIVGVMVPVLSHAFDLKHLTSSGNLIVHTVLDSIRHFLISSQYNGSIHPRAHSLCSSFIEKVSLKMVKKRRILNCKIQRWQMKCLR